jgi:hypothetical protein
MTDESGMQLTAPARPASAAVRFLPTHADTIFLAILAWCFLAGENGMARLLMDGDTGVHIRIGDWIREHGAVPRTDLFGFSKPHETWYAYEWLSGVIFSMANSAAGLKGVTLLTATLLALVPSFLILHAVWRGASGVVAVPVVMLGTSVLNIHFLARPHVFTLVLLAAAVWMIERDRRDPSRRIWLLVPLMAIWANLHGGFFIVFPYLALLGIGSMLERKAGLARRYGLVLAACLAATLFNPYGWNLHWHVVSYLRSGWVVKFVDEFQSPKFRSETMTCFMILLFLGLAAAGALYQRKKYTEVLWILFFSYCALTSVRHATVWVVAVAPLLAEELTAWWPATHRMISFQLRSMTAWPALAAASLAFLPASEWPAQFPRDLFPVSLVERRLDLLRTSRAFTTDQWADYLIWRNYPAQQVFMDARHNYFGEAIGNDFLKLIHAKPGWKEAEARYRFDAYLLPTDCALSSVLRERTGWTALDGDSQATLFVRSQAAATQSASASLRPPGYRSSSGSGPERAPAAAR